MSELILFENRTHLSKSFFTEDQIQRLENGESIFEKIGDGMFLTRKGGIYFAYRQKVMSSDISPNVYMAVHRESTLGYIFKEHIESGEDNLFIGFNILKPSGMKGSLYSIRDGWTSVSKADLRPATLRDFDSIENGGFGVKWSRGYLVDWDPQSLLGETIVTA